VTAFCLNFTIGSELKSSAVTTLLRAVRLARFFRYFTVFERLKVIAETFLDVLKPGVAQFTLVMMWYYFYGIIGMYIFGDKLVAGNPDLEGTDYAKLNYAALVSFSNMWRTYLTLFHLMLVNNMAVTLNAAMAATSRWACLFFIIFWTCTIVIILNLFVATVMDIFASNMQKNYEERMKKKRETKRAMKKHKKAEAQPSTITETTPSATTAAEADNKPNTLSVELTEVVSPQENKVAEEVIIQELVQEQITSIETSTSEVNLVETPAAESVS